jgi:V/A-type H+-transporting ATPase subunit I
VVLGTAIGAWQAARFSEHRTLFDKLGTLLALGGLFGVAGWAADQLPAGALTPAFAATVVGLVLVMSLHGALGLVTGPLEFMGTLGNVLSYLRLAAVGLASAHLAAVANELATVGPIWLGVLVAVFFHSLNLALAAFSPTIQALRLHYVEFFGAFLVGGGRAFSPFGHARRATPSTT